MRTKFLIASSIASASATLIRPLSAIIDSMFLQDSPRNYVQPLDLDSTKWGNIPCEFISPNYEWYNFVDMDSAANSYYQTKPSSYPIAYWNFC